ncbi:Hyaluronan/mRNA-binding protein [Dillenia turbinata]|uniref:Hyaluronan/mRNA-binding protein n=1 Tax=Dillenia turbinata TaxID=194707 RepID=A0AAN8ZIC9_9MAGN
MATANPFDLLGDDDNEDPSQLIAAQQKVVASATTKKGSVPAQAAAAAKPTAKMPSKPLPPAQAVREARNDTGRGGGRGGGRGFGRGRGERGGGGPFNHERDSSNNENSFSSNNGYLGGYRPSDDGEAGRPSERRGGYGGPRGPFRDGRRGGFTDGEVAEGEQRPRRVFDRRSGTGRGNEFKREGAGRGNWGATTDEITQVTEEPTVENEKNVATEKRAGEEEAGDATKESPVTEQQEKEPEEKEMTLDEYEKVLEEKRKALLALKTEERKVGLDKDFESMQQLSNKKDNDDVFIKLGSEKDKRREAVEKEEKAKKSVSINEFLKPTDGERYYAPGGRGRGRGRGSRGGFGGGGHANNVPAPAIEDPGQFPSLGAK